MLFPVFAVLGLTVTTFFFLNGKVPKVQRKNNHSVDVASAENVNTVEIIFMVIR